MRNKLLLSIGIFIVGCLGLWAINYFVYSWIGFGESLIGFCENKQVGLNGSSSSRGISLDEVIDLKKLADETRSNSDYKTDLRGDYALYLERTLNGKPYQLLLENNKLVDSTWFKFSENQQNQNKESCKLPNYWIMQDVYNMIDNLPLKENQKNRVKDNLRISISIHLSLG